ncbi:MAG: hypothetical protein P8Y97_03015 [Candidatus Lokiarchaeota archaeon]
MEEIIFNEGNLDDLKQKIFQFKKGNISENDFWKFFISHKAKILQNIMKKISLILNLNSKYQNPKTNNQPNQDNARLQQELKERNDLLVLVAKKVNDLCNQGY